MQKDDNNNEFFSLTDLDNAEASDNNSEVTFNELEYEFGSNATFTEDEVKAPLQDEAKADKTKAKAKTVEAQTPKEDDTKEEKKVAKKSTRKKKKTEDESVTAKEVKPPTDSEAQKTAKKLMILYVLEVLNKYSDENHKLTQHEIIEKIKEEYGMDCERKAVSRHIKSLIEHGYNIETYEMNNQGYYLVEKDFTPDDVFALWEGLMSSKYLDKAHFNHLCESLMKYSGGAFRLGNSFYGGIVNHFTCFETKIYESLMFLVTEMALKKKVQFIYNKYDTDKTLVPIARKPFVVTPYAVLNVDNVYYLAARVEGKKELSCFNIGLITDLEHLEFLGEEIYDIIGYSKGFNKELFLATFINGYGGEITDFIIQIGIEHMGELITKFGENVKILSNKDGLLTIDITTNFDNMYLWAIHHADHCEVIEPPIMRFKIKKYFDEQSWKYR